MREHTARCFEETYAFELTRCRNVRLHKGGVIAFADIGDQCTILILQDILQFTAVNGTTNNTAQRGVQLRHFQRVARQFLINRNDFIQFVLGRVEFYSKAIADGVLDTNDVLDKFLELRGKEAVVTGDNQARSASEFELDESKIAGLNQQVNDDVLVIDRNLKGLDYQLAKCCSPIYGDDVFGFVTVNGGIKIHRCDCPNAPELRRRFGYRIVKAKWSGKGSSQYSIALRVIGNDDIGIVNNLTSIISKEEKLVLRSINIDSHDGLFSGNIVVMLEDTSRLEALIKKLRTVKGVKQVDRI